MTKFCKKCQNEKPAIEFSKDARNRDGLQSWCRLCTKIAASKWHAANPEKVKAWYAANPDKAKARANKLYADNPGKVKATAAKWRAENPGKIKEIQARYRAANPEAKRIEAHNRRAIKRENGGKLSKDIANKLFKLQRGRCACGCGLPLGEDFHRDHRMPVALGGANEDWNIQLLRAKCNLQKNAKHPIDFMQQRGFLL